MATPTHSAVILPVPEAGAVIDAWRRRFDRSAAWGVPAHVTLLFPFVPPSAIDEAVVARLRTAIGGFGAVVFDLAALRRFDDGTLYLLPSPDDRLRELTARVVAAFPDYPPYGGAVADPHPHVTVGEAAQAAGSTDAEPAIAARLPIPCRVEEARLMAGAAESGGWTVVERVAL